MLLSLDIALFRLINHHLRHPWLDVVFRAVHDVDILIVPLVVAAVVGLVFAPPRWKYLLVLAGLTVALADLVGNDIKIATAQPRPYGTVEVAPTPGIDYNEGDNSFPSNHTANLFAVAVFMALFLRRRRWLVAALFVLAGLVAWSRVYNGIHFPSDVVAGAALGALCALVMRTVDRRWPPLVFPESEEGADGAPAGRPRIDWNGLTALLSIFGVVYLFSWILRGDFPLASEETQYWDWSRRLDLSYFSKPPAIAYLIRAFTSVFGSTPFGVRSTAATLAILMGVVAWIQARRAYDSPRVAFFALLALFTLPLYSVGVLLITTDTPLLVCWAGCCLFLYLVFVEDRAWAWWPAALCFGLGLLSKYAMIYMVLCLVVFFVWSRPHRAWLRRKEPWLFLLVGALCFIPVIVWNHQHDWITFRHVAWQAGANKGFRLTPGRFFSYIGEQAGVAGPLLFLGMAWVAIRLVFCERHTAPARDRFLLCMALPVYCLLLAKSLQGKVQGNWAAPAYYAWTILAVGRFDEFWRRPLERKTRRRALIFATATLGVPILAFFLLHEPSVFAAIRQGLARVGIHLSAKVDPVYRFLGYDKLGKWATWHRDQMPDPDRVFFITRRYQLAAQMAFHIEGQPRTHTVNFEDRRMTQYTLWGNPGEEYKGWDAIYVTPGDADYLRPEVAVHFESWWGPDYLTIHRYGVKYRQFSLFRCFNFDGEFENAIEAENPIDVEEIPEAPPEEEDQE